MELNKIIKDNKIIFADANETSLAVLDFEVENDVIFVTHTNVSEVLRGQGIAGKLMEEICKYADENSMKIKPICSYAVSYLEKHTEYSSLLAE